MQVKSYKRRLKSGKVVIVKAHTAKRDVDASQKPGAGEEYIINQAGQKSSLDTIPYNVQTFSDDEFKEWYKFNDWDSPRSKWPKAVREVDDRLRQSMTKKNYDAYCAMVDENWSARGTMSALTKYSSYCKDGSPAQAKSRIKRSTVPDTNKDVDGVTAERKAMIVKNIRESMRSGDFKPTPHALSKAYQSGDKQLIKDVEDALRDFINREGTKYPEALDSTIRGSEFGISLAAKQLKEENLNKMPKALSTNMFKIENENNLKAHKWIKAECERLQKDLKKKTRSEESINSEVERHKKAIRSAMDYLQKDYSMGRSIAVTRDAASSVESYLRNKIGDRDPQGYRWVRDDRGGNRVDFVISRYPPKSTLASLKETYSAPDERPKMAKSQQMKYDTLADFNRNGLNLTSRVNGTSRKMGGGVIVENSGMSIPEKTRLNYIANKLGYEVGDWSGHEYYLQKIDKKK